MQNIVRVIDILVYAVSHLNWGSFLTIRNQNTLWLRAGLKGHYQMVHLYVFG